MNTRQQHHSEGILPNRMHNNNNRNDVTFFLSEVLRSIIEFPFWLFLLTIKVLRNSPVIQECYNVFIDLIIHIIRRIAQDPIIQETISTTISEGMNRFVEQPDLDQLLLHMVTSISKSQPDIARQQGQDFPIVVSSFVQGILHHAVNRKPPQKVNPNNNKSGSQIHTGDSSQDLKSLQLSLEHLGTEAVECSIENTNCMIVDGSGQTVEDSIADESQTAATLPFPPNNEDETMNDNVIVSTSSSSSSMITVTATVPTDRQLLRSEEHEAVESSPSSQVDESNNQFTHADKSSLDSDDISETTYEDAILPDKVKFAHEKEELLDTAPKNKQNGRWW